MKRRANQWMAPPLKSFICGRFYPFVGVFAAVMGGMARATAMFFQKVLVIWRISYYNVFILRIYATEE